jgi:hypothetical protein
MRALVGSLVWGIRAMVYTEWLPKGRPNELESTMWKQVQFFRLLKFPSSNGGECVYARMLFTRCCSWVSIATRLRAGGMGFDSWHRKIFFSSQNLFRPTVESIKPLFNGYQCLFLGIMRLGHEVNKSVHLEPRLRMHAFVAWTGINLCDCNYWQIGGVTKVFFLQLVNKQQHTELSWSNFSEDKSVRSEDKSTIEIRQGSVRLWSWKFWLKL